MTNSKSNFIVFGNPDEIKTYRETERVNQSTLKKLLSNSIVKEEESSTLYYEEKSHFIIGNAVDLLLTVGSNQFISDFYISDIQKPSDTIMSIINLLYDRLKQKENSINNNVTVYGNELLEAIKEHKYREEWNNTARVNYVSSKGSDYFKLLADSNGRTIISKAENEKILSIVDRFRKDDKFGFLFNQKLISKVKDKNIAVFHQVPVYWTEIINKETPIECKALIDTIVVDITNKTIKIFDIKTTGDVVLNFTNSIKALRYDLQLAFYYRGLMQSISNMPLLKEYSDFKFLQPSLLVASAVTNEKIVEFEMSRQLLDNATFGRATYVTPFGIKVYPVYGYKNALKAYLFYKENGFSDTFMATANNRKLVISEYYDY